MAERTDIHGPEANAPEQSGEVAHCKVCKCQWSVRGDADKKGCNFCGADDSAISIEYEAEN